MIIFNGNIIAFSGIDGAGKSTQIDLLIQHLKGNNRKFIRLWTRGGYTGPFNFLKGIFRKLMGKRLPPSGRNEKRDQAFRKPLLRKLWLYLALIDLCWIYGCYMRFYRLMGWIVLADRYLWDTWIDFRLNFQQESISTWKLWNFLVKFAPLPDLAFLLSVPVEVSLIRSTQKKEPFPDSEKVLKQRFSLYEEIALIQNWHKIDCTRTTEYVHQSILKVIEQQTKYKKQVL